MSNKTNLHDSPDARWVARPWSRCVEEILDRYRMVMFALMVVAYCAGFNGQWQLEPDSALFLTLGRNLALGRGYTYHGAPHTLAYPGLPMALAVVFRIFGSHAIAAADAMILGCGLIALAFTYRLLLLAFDRPTAVVVTLGVGVTHEFFRYCFEIMTDVPFLMGVMAFLAGHEAIFHARKTARWWDWALLIGGLIVAVVTRPTMIGLLVIWIGTMLWSAFRRPGSRKIPLIGVGLACLALFLFIWFDPRRTAGGGGIGDYEQFAFFQLTHNLGSQLRTEGIANFKELFCVDLVRSVFGTLLGPLWVNSIFSAIILIAGIGLIRLRAIWGLWVAMTVLISILLVSHDRYILQILPLLVLAWWLLLKKINLGLPRSIGNICFILLFFLGVFPNAGLNGAGIIHQQQRPFLANYKEGRLWAYVVMAQELTRFVTPADVVVCPDKIGRILTFESDRNVTEPDEISMSNSRGIFVVLDPSDDQYRRELAAHSISFDAVPLLSISRGENAPPLLLLRGVQSR